MNRECESSFFSLSPQQLALLGAVFGVLLSCELNLNEQNVLGNFFSSMGQTLQTISAQGSLLQSNNDSNNQILDKINHLKQQICLLEQEVNGCK